jgi:hypothetical protein
VVGKGKLDLEQLVRLLRALETLQDAPQRGLCRLAFTVGPRSGEQRFDLAQLGAQFRLVVNVRSSDW